MEGAVVPLWRRKELLPGEPPRVLRAMRGGASASPSLLPLRSPAQEDMLKTLRVLAGLDLLIDCFGVNWSYLYLQPGQVAT